MRWPWVSRHRLDAVLDRVARISAELDSAQARETYWRERCERLTDAALVRAGAIHEPTFVERPSTDEAGGNPFEGMLMGEIPQERIAG